jgi:hypothetical protein
MATFKRYTSKRLIESLKKESLFSEKLLPDVKKLEVFPAFRSDGVYFYYYGGRLFTYDGSFFRTHRKFIPYPAKKDYLSEDELKEAISVSFINCYSDIKDLCAHYSGEEDKGISNLYNKFNYLNYLKMNADIVVLDIEISFDGSEYEVNDTNNIKNKKGNRIDLLLFNATKQELMFVEAKHFTNRDLWSKKNTPPEISRQLNKYAKQINKRENEILKNYCSYIDNIDLLFDIKLPEPKECLPYCGLYVFGFDIDQRDGRLKDILLNDGSLKGFGYYCLGDQSKIDSKTLWKEIYKKAVPIKY